jgi:hypothetical protein
MIDPARYTPELYDLDTYNRPFDYLKTVASEELLEFQKSPDKKIALLDINHADGDAVGSAVNFAILFEMLDVPYLIDSYNSSSKLTFSTIRLPLNDIKTYLEKDTKILFITTDNTPWYPFYSDLDEVYRHPKAKENFKLMILDHHPFVGKEEGSKIKEEEREKEGFIYHNYGLSKEANIWWRGPNIPCAGEITFYIVSDILEKLNKYNLEAIRRFLIPTLVSSYTDLRTHKFLDSISDEKVKNIAEDYTNVGIIDEWQGYQTHFELFNNLANGAYRVSGLKVADKYDTYFLTEAQRLNSPTHKLLKSIAAHVMVTAKIGNPMVLTRLPKDLGYAYENGYHLLEILEADKEWGKIKSIARNAFLYFDTNHYKLRHDRASYFKDTKAVVVILPKLQTIVQYKGTNIDLSKLLKYPPYIEFFLTAYHRIAEIETIKNSSIIIVGVESSRSEGYAEFSFRSYSPSIPVGYFASEIAHKVRKEYVCPHYESFGGGHPTAGGLRMKQRILDELKIKENLDVYSLINEWIKKISL